MNRKIYIKLLSLMVTLSLLLTACTAVSAVNPTTPVVQGSNANVATEWMDLICHLVQNQGMNPPQSSRLYAYAGAALYESALPGMPGYRSLSGQLNGMPPMPAPEAGQQYDWPSSITGAMSVIARGFFASGSANTLQAIADLHDLQLKSRATVASNAVINRSAAFGESIGNTIFGWASQDGFQATRGLAYTPPTGPGMWVPTPPDFKPPLEPYWGQLRTFALHSVDSCVPGAPVPYSTDNESVFYQQALAVYQVSASLDNEKLAVAQFWADNAGESFTPPGHWLSIEDQMVSQLKLSLDKAAEMYALAGIAMGDAFISCWHAKYQYCVPRPVTYINQHIDSKWQPQLSTPAFPEYTSGHSVVSGAVSTVLSRLLGKVSFSDASYAANGVPPRSFNSFEMAAQEAAVSRLYAGIHYPITIQNGLSQGQMVGQALLDRVQTRTP